MSSSWEIAFISLQVTCVVVQHGPMGLFPAKNLIQLADNNGFENASLAEIETKVKDKRTVAHALWGRPYGEIDTSRHSVNSGVIVFIF